MTEEFPVVDVIKKFNTTSRYKNTDIYKNPADNLFYYGIWTIPVIDKQPQDIYYVIEAGGSRRLDKVAQNFYNNYLLWWIIATANDIIDPFDELEVGQTIRIPYLPYIFSKVLV